MGARLGIISFIGLGIAACSPPDWVGDAPPQADVPKTTASAKDERVTAADADAECTGDADACNATTAAPAAPATPSSQPAPPAPSGGVTACCGKKGTCVAAKSVPEDDREDLEQKECAAGQLCAPNENLDDDFEPPRCKGDLVAGSYDGVCVSNCVSFDFFSEMVTVQGTCDSDHRCVPCRTAFGIPTGAPGCE